MLKLILGPNGGRQFSNSTVLQQAETEKKLTKPPESPENIPGNPAVEMSFKPTEYEKLLLVLSGKFKSKEEIPSRISFNTMENAKSRIRIRGSNILMVGTLCLCGFYVWLGKKKAREGQTINKMALERNKEILLEAQKRNEKGI